MIPYKKILAVIISLVLIGVLGYYIYDINAMYPNPKNIAVRQGQSFNYKGATVETTDMQVYGFEELIKEYPELETAYDVMGEEGEKQKKSAKDYNYFCVEMNVRNNQSQTINFVKEGITNWVMEISTYANGMDYFYFQTLNKNYKRILEPGEMEQVFLCYGILDGYVSLQQMKADDIKLVYSYYPTKNYVLKEGE